jgi:tellurite resistance protein TerC
MWADIIFALDSIPAVIAITPDLFIAYTSNIFAILGLGSLMRILKKMKNELFYLKYFIALITIFVGVKLLIMNFFHIPTGVSFSIILGTLICGVMVSLFAKKPVKD